MWMLLSSALLILASMMMFIADSYLLFAVFLICALINLGFYFFKPKI